MTSPALLTLDNLQFAYQPDAPVLRQVSFEAAVGSITAILGPNGAGKTTLLKLILGLLRPHSGEILLAGKNLRRYTRRELSRWIGLVPQRESVPFEYTVLEYVLLGRAPYLGPLDQPSAADVAISRQALARLEIEEIERRVIPELSGGELQLVMVARSLAQQTRILLLDEPTSHLDLSNKYRVLDILRGLAREGTTILFTTHDPESASLVADGLVLVAQGQVLAAGPVEETFTAEKLSATYGVAVEVLRVDGRKIVVQREGTAG